MTSSNSHSNMSQQPSPNNIQTADISPIPPTAAASTTTTGSHYNNNNHHIHHYINDRGHHHSHYYINRDGSTTSSFEDDNQQEQDEYNNNNTHHQDEEEEEEYYDDEETTASYTSSDSEHHSHHHHHNHLKPLFTTSKHSSQPKASTSTSTVANNTKNNARYYVSRDEDGTNTPTKRQNSTGQEEEEDDDSSYTITIHTEDQPPNANIQVKIGTSGEEKAFLVTRETTSPTSISAIAAHSDDLADYESGKLSSSSIATEEGSEATVQVVTHSLRYQILGTAAAAAYFMACSTVLLFVMNFVHARVPKVEPLPDIGHDIITHLQPEFLGDIVMITMYVMLGGCLLLSGNRRWKMATRFLFAYGTLYLIRTTTISATSMPATKNHCYYNPEPIENIWWNTFIGLVTMGSLNKHCGDLLFSGHTCSITLILLVFWCYHSRHVLLNLVLTLVGVTGFVFIIGTRSHYTVDVLVALYLTVFVWGVCPESWDKPLFQMKKGKNQIVNVYRKLSGYVLPSRRHIRI